MHVVAPRRGTPSWLPRCGVGYAEPTTIFGVPPPRFPRTSDPFLASIARYYRIIQSKTKDLFSPDGFELNGIYFMAERLHYHDTENEETDGERR